MPLYNKIDEDQWVEIYEPITESSGIPFYETYGKDLEYIKSLPPEYVWTLLDADNGKIVLVNGIHWVNRIAYTVTKNPWKEEVLVEYD
jgi:hypothetical protein